ncbi:poly(ADP-ribose) glycohydrolase domain-containing protein [Brevibacillus sp. NRS-1366]|uniref:poly(ADP-ribose) glycohydrolase domain-containing protein n=1 Tax=Brevibacillus sp. NRS-1366 TaxID=3233899 RepID=UPI003D249FCC
MKQGHNRNRRVKIAQETLQIVEQGHYVNNDGQKISLSEELSYAISHSRLYRPDDLNPQALANVVNEAGAVIEVSAESSLEAARRSG